MQLKKDFNLVYSPSNAAFRDKTRLLTRLGACPQAVKFFAAHPGEVYEAKSPNREGVGLLISVGKTFGIVVPEGAAFCAYPPGPGEAVGWFRHDIRTQELQEIDETVEAEDEPADILAQPTEVVMQAAGNIQNAGHPQLRDRLDDWVPRMSEWLVGRGHWTAAAATGFGAQATPNNCKVGTASLDFQGIRAGSGGTFWIDLQAQVGGGGSPRLSYAQVLIQSRIGRVADDVIVGALNRSLREGQFRALIRQQNSQHTPN